MQTLKKLKILHNKKKKNSKIFLFTKIFPHKDGSQEIKPGLIPDMLSNNQISKYKIGLSCFFV